MFPLRDDVARLRWPILTVLLILANVGVFLWQSATPTDSASTPALAQLGVSEREEQTLSYGAIPHRILNPGDECGVTAVAPRRTTVVCEGQAEAVAVEEAGLPVVAIDAAAWWLTLITSMFMHGGILHLLGNMLFLWVFGASIEGALGRARFAAFYLTGGVVAVYAQALLDPGSTIPTIGASGAVATVLGGYAVLFPRARVLTLVFIVFFVTLVYVPAMALLGVWLALQLLPFAGQLATADVGTEGGIAYLAHIGGFAYGFLLLALLRKRIPRAPPRPPRAVY